MRAHQVAYLVETILLGPFGHIYSFHEEFWDLSSIRTDTSRLSPHTNGRLAFFWRLKWWVSWAESGYAIEVQIVWIHCFDFWRKNHWWRIGLLCIGLPCVLLHLDLFHRIFAALLYNWRYQRYRLRLRHAKTFSHFLLSLQYIDIGDLFVNRRALFFYLWLLKLRILVHSQGDGVSVIIAFLFVALNVRGGDGLRTHSTHAYRWRRKCRSQYHWSNSMSITWWNC